MPTSANLAFSANTTPSPTGTLYIVATPIGNLTDISLRAIDCLKQVEVIAAEDTRHAKHLLDTYNINTKTIAYHEHNTAEKTNQLITWLKNGQNIALISDAGTPLISDPGFRLVQAAHAAKVRVCPIAGCCAAIAALSVSGLPSDRFSFIGFLPAKKQARQKRLQEVSQKTETLIFYEAPHRILACVKDMAIILGGNRSVALCRELTKTFETVHHTQLAALVDFINNDTNQQKGEIVLVVAGASNQVEQIDNEINPLLTRLLQDLSVKKAANLAAELTGQKKNALYQLALQLKEKS